MRILLFGALLCCGSACTGTIDGGSTVPPSGETGTTGTEGGVTSGGTPGDPTGTSGTASASGGVGTTTMGTGGTSGTGTTGSAQCGDGLTSRRLRRLSWREYASVVGDLLDASAKDEALATLPAEPTLSGFDNQDSALRVNGLLAETISDLAASLASEANVETVAPCTEPSGSAACLDSFIQSFATRAYGRPPTTDEADRMSQVAALGEDYAESVRLVIEVVLQSPNLIYVSELGAPNAPATPGQPLQLTDYETASQLSFLLTGHRPDAVLLDKAERGELSTPDALRAEAQRLLGTPEGQDALRRFVVGWLDMGPIAEAPKSPEFFPELTPTVVSAMQQEFDAFLTAQIDAGNGTLAGLMTAPSTLVPSELLPIYGSDYTPGVGFDPARRGGVLSLPGLLTYHSARDHSGPIERGLFVRRQLLCTDVPSPPASAVAIIAANPIQTGDTSITTRQKFEQHASDGACRACHAQFDPIGFGLEDMDGIGRFRTTENGLEVDSSGELVGTDIDGPFEGVIDLSNKLLGSETFAHCMVEHYFRFAMARRPAAADQCVVDDWSRAFREGGETLRDLVLTSVADPTFTTRKDDR